MDIIRNQKGFKNHGASGFAVMSRVVDDNVELLGRDLFGRTAEVFPGVSGQDNHTRGFFETKILHGRFDDQGWAFLTDGKESYELQWTDPEQYALEPEPAEAAGPPPQAPVTQPTPSMLLPSL